MNIDLDYKRTPKAVEQISNSELTVDYINFAANSAHQGGLEGQQRRIFGRIQRKLDAAVEAKQTEVELELAELDFIVKCFEMAKFPANLSQYVMVLQDEIDRAKDNKD